jgi:Na+-translocating ferredoxin:NAD+ oxidoreductase RnfE subunit
MFCLQEHACIQRLMALACASVFTPSLLVIGSVRELLGNGTHIRDGATTAYSTLG